MEVSAHSDAMSTPVGTRIALYQVDFSDQTTKGETVSTAVTEAMIEQVVSDSLERFGAPPEEIVREANLKELDIDSLDLAELAQIVEEHFGVELKSSDVADVKTVEDAILLIASRV
jgi:acyl carrier protein